MEDEFTEEVIVEAVEEEIVSAVIAPIFPCQPVFPHFAFSRAIWTLNHTTYSPLYQAKQLV